MFGQIVDQLIIGLKKYASNNKDMTVNVTDTVGSPANGYAMYLDLKMKKDRHQLEYTLKCENEDTVTSKVALTFAYDATNLSGGYGNNATGIGVIIKHFDSDFLAGFQKSQRIKIDCKLSQPFSIRLKHAWNGE